MNRSLMAVAVAAGTLIAAGEAHATAVVTVNDTATKTIAISSALAPDTIGQTFVPTEDRLTGLGFRFGSSTATTTGSVTLSIYSGAIAAGAALPATALFSGQYALTGLVFRGVGNFTNLFSGNLAVTPNAAYTAILTGSSNVVLAFGTGEGYAPGYLLQTTVNDATCRTTPTSCDASFRFATAASVAAVPEPATWAMMLTGMLLVGGALRYRRRTTTVAFGRV